MLKEAKKDKLHLLGVNKKLPQVTLRKFKFLDLWYQF